MKTMLIIDDELPFLMSLRDGLSIFEEFISVLISNSGKEALDIIRKKSVDLILLDIKMPDMDGLQFLGHLNLLRKDVPTIVMTAFGTIEMERKLKKLGIKQYLEKPLDFTALAELVMKEISKE